MTTLSGKWHHVASNERLQRSSQAVAMLDSQVYVFGGELVPRQPVDDRVDLVRLSPSQGSYAGFRVSSQDPSTGLPFCWLDSNRPPYLDTPIAETLASIGSGPSPRVGSPFTTLQKALYLFSGRGGVAMAPVEENGSLWRYTPECSSWDQLKPKDASAPFPAGRSYHSLASDGRETIYLHAGCPETGRLADLWAFNITSASWTKLPDAPPPSRGGPSLAFHDGRLFRMNGFDGKAEQGGALDIYDTRTGSWSTHVFSPDSVEGPESRSVSTLVALTIEGRGHLVTMFGERDPSSLGHAGAGKMLSDVWAFDIEEQKWRKIIIEGESPSPRGWFDADIMNEGEPAIIVHGGLAEDNSRLGDVWKLTILN